jgi:hypothetical protein
MEVDESICSDGSVMEGFDDFIFGDPIEDKKAPSPPPSVETSLYCPDFEGVEDFQPTELISIELSIQESITYFSLRVNHYFVKSLKKLVYACVLHSANLKFLEKALRGKRGSRGLSGLRSKRYKIFCSDLNHISTKEGDGIIIYETTRHNPSEICKKVLKSSCYVRTTAEVETLIRPLQTTEVEEWNESKNTLINLSSDVIPANKGLKDRNVVSYCYNAVSIFNKAEDGEEDPCRYRHCKRLLKDEIKKYTPCDYNLDELAILKDKLISSSMEKAEKELQNYCIEGSERHKTYLEAVASQADTGNITKRMAGRYEALSNSKDVNMKLYWEWVEETMASRKDGITYFSKIPFTSRKELIKEAEMLIYMYCSDIDSMEEVKKVYANKKAFEEKAKSLLGNGVVNKERFVENKVSELIGGELKIIKSKIDERKSSDRSLKMINVLKGKINEIKEYTTVNKIIKKVGKKGEKPLPPPSELLKLFNPYEALSDDDCSSDGEGGYSSPEEFDWFDLDSHKSNKRRGKVKLNSRDLADSISVMLSVERPEVIYSAVNADKKHPRNSIPRLRIREPLLLLSKQIGFLRRGVKVKNIDKHIHGARGCTVKYSNGNIQRMLNAGLIPKTSEALDYVKNMLITSS